MKKKIKESMYEETSKYLYKKKQEKNYLYKTMS